MSWQARRWADEQRPRSPMCKYVLLAFAHFANKHGESWPSYDTLREYTLADRKTVWAAIKMLREDGYIVDTGKRAGNRIRVYKLSTTVVPKTELPVVPVVVPPVVPVVVPVLVPKTELPTLGAPIPIPDPDTLNPISSDNTLGVITPTGKQTNPEVLSDSLVEKYQHQNTPARDHPKWQEFDAYCRSRLNKRGQPGQPTETGFWTWRSKQNPKWRDKVAPKFEGEQGYLLNGKFYTKAEADSLAKQNSDVITQFCAAIRRPDGTSHPIKK